MYKAPEIPFIMLSISGPTWLTESHFIYNFNVNYFYMSILNDINSLNIVQSEKKIPLLTFKNIGPIFI